MKTLRWSAPALAAAIWLGAGPSAASPPDAALSSVDAVGVGTSSGLAAGGSPAAYHVVVRDHNNAPVLGATVVLYFGVVPGVRVYTAQSASTTVNPAARTVGQVAVDGTTTFALRTGGYLNLRAVQVVANGVVLGESSWRSTDVDAADGKTGLNDVTFVANTYLSGVYAPECNLDRSALDYTGLGDVTVVASEYLNGSTGTYAW